MSKLQMTMQFRDKGKSDDCPVYDIHGHMGMFYNVFIQNPEPASIIQMMDKAGVKLLVFCHHFALLCPDISNIQSIEAVMKFPGRFRAYCVINPNYPDIMEKDLGSFESNKEFYAGLKFWDHNVAYNDSRYIPALKFAERRNLPVLFHTWGGGMHDGEMVIRELAEKYIHIKMILGHSCHGAWEEAAKLARDFPNVYLETTAVMDQRAGILERLVETSGSGKILFGTDFPWFSYHYYIGAILASEITEDDAKNNFFRNAIKLFNLDKNPDNKTY